MNEREESIDEIHAHPGQQGSDSISTVEYAWIDSALGLRRANMPAAKASKKLGSESVRSGATKAHSAFLRNELLGFSQTPVWMAGLRLPPSRLDPFAMRGLTPGIMQPGLLRLALSGIRTAARGELLLLFQTTRAMRTRAICDAVIYM